MRARILIYFFFFFISSKGFSQYDSLAMDKFIDKYIVLGDESVIYARVSDSIDRISKSDHKKYILQVYHKAKTVNNKFMVGNAYNSLALWYMGVAMYSDAYTNLNHAINTYRSINSDRGLFSAYSNLGLLYSYMGQYKKAMIYNLKALQIVNSNDKISFRYSRSTNICLNIGAMHGYMNNLPLARDYFYKALNYYNLDPDKDSITRSYILNNIADTYLYEKDYKTAQKYNDLAFDIKLKYGTDLDKADAYLHKGSILEELGKNEEAKELYLRSLFFHDTLMPNERLSVCYSGLANIFSKLKDFKNENKYLKLNYKTRVYIDSIGRVLEINNSEIKNEFRQVAINDSIQNQIQLKVLDVKIEQKKRESIYGVIALAIMSVLALLFFKRYRLSQKQKTLIENQKQIVEEKNREITDSINYAKNLQDALIPDPSELSLFFPDAFVLYMPKDIVAGDFYWWHRFSNTNKILVAVADCTGHGVPGAMVSVVCINALNRAVNEFNLSEPNEILNKVNQLVNETFGKNNKQVNDGMDISLMLIDKDKDQVKWSGANNKLIYFNGGEMFVLNPDKQPIGKNENHTPFTLQTLPFEKDFMVYLITDGFSDQFGGERNKKMGFSQFKNLLNTNYSRPMDEQKSRFEEFFINWKNKGEQTDDVTLIGIKL